MKTRFLQYKPALELLLGFFLAYGGILFFFSEKTNFEELALGTETVTSLAMDSLHRPIHLLHLSTEEIGEVLSGWKERGAKPVVLILGNSQTHSINQLKSGDVNFVELIAKRIDKNQDVLCASFPNANLQELFLTYQYLKTIVPIKQLVVPVFMDDFREDGVREVFFSKLINDRFLCPDSSNEVISKINNDLVKYWNLKTNQQLNRSIESLYDDETPQDVTERFLTSKLDSNSRTWSNRSNVRGEFFNWLYKFRNTVFQIKANTVRAMIPNRFETNRKALEELIRTCSSDHVRTLVYIPPIRNDAQLPYEVADYQHFKELVAQMCAKKGKLVSFKNYEHNVRNQYWGYKASTDLIAEREVDYMHFQYVGHQIMADSIRTFLNSQSSENGF